MHTYIHTNKHKPLPTYIVQLLFCIFLMFECMYPGMYYVCMYFLLYFCMCTYIRAETSTDTVTYLHRATALLPFLVTLGLCHALDQYQFSSFCFDSFMLQTKQFVFNAKKINIAFCGPDRYKHWPEHRPYSNYRG
jgi:hypothetical protein